MLQIFPFFSFGKKNCPVFPALATPIEMIMEWDLLFYHQKFQRGPCSYLSHETCKEIRAMLQHIAPIVTPGQSASGCAGLS